MARMTRLTALAIIPLALAACAHQHTAAPAAASTVRCGLLSCPSGSPGAPCSIAGYPGIIVQASATSLACDPSPKVPASPAVQPAPVSPEPGFTCLMGYVNIPAGSGMPVSGKQFQMAAPSPDTADGYDLGDYEAMRVVISASQMVTVSTVTIVWYDSSGSEIGSGSADIGQVITAGQSLGFTYDESMGSSPNPPRGAATCDVVSWSGQP